MKRLMMLLSLMCFTLAFAKEPDVTQQRRTKYWYFGISDIPYNAHVPSINIGFHQDIKDTVFFIEPSLDLITITDDYLGFRLNIDSAATYSSGDIDYYGGLGLKYEYMNIDTSKRKEYFSYLAPSVNLGLIYHRNKINPLRVEINMVCPSYYISTNDWAKQPKFGWKWTIGF